MKGQLLILFFIFSLTCCSGTYQLILHSFQRGAACLDGSPAGMYIHEGNGPNKDKFMIYFNGGGFCGAQDLSSTIQSCYQRSFTSLGTTTVYQKQKTFDGEGILSTNEDQNPTFHDWTKIFAIYCDGAEHQGYRESPISYKGRDLFFRGTRNTLEQFHYLSEKYDFYNKDSIVITGVSAGGMATFQWVEYLQEHTKTSKVYGIPDSGLFLTDYYSPIVQQKVIRIQAQSLLKLVGTNEDELPGPVRKCIDQIDDLVSCYDASNYAKYITASLFLIQSTYDEWVLQNLLVVQCLSNKHYPFSISTCNDTTRAAVEDYRHAVIKSIYKIKNNRNDVGIWGPACIQHGFSDHPSFTSEDYKVPSVTGLKIFEAIDKYLENPNEAPWLLDQGQWPTSNPGCNGLSRFNLLRK